MGEKGGPGEGGGTLACGLLNSAGKAFRTGRGLEAGGMDGENSRTGPFKKLPWRLKVHLKVEREEVVAT